MVSSFIKARKLSFDLVQSIMSQFSDLGKADIVDSNYVFNRLSNSLKVEVARYTSRPVIEKVPIMAECNSNFLDALAVLFRVRPNATAAALVFRKMLCDPISNVTNHHLVLFRRKC